MAETVYPGAIWSPGLAAGYSLAPGKYVGPGQGPRTYMQLTVCHYTAGRNSGSLISSNGLAQWLVGRDGTLTQYAEADALCFGAGEWNIYGPSIEVEYLDEPTIFTDEARVACGGLVRWLNSEWGFPLDYIDTPEARMSTSDQRGFVSHRSLYEAPVNGVDQNHYDYWPAEDFAAMTQGDDMALTDDDVNKVVLGLAKYLTGQEPTYNGTYTNFGDVINWLSGAQPLANVPNIAQAIAAGGGGSGSGLSADEVRTVVAEELAKKGWR